jgi:DNA-binding MarR family transcriptional regulator
MDRRISSTRRVVSVIRELVDPEVPLQQLALLLLIAEAGEEGITMPDAGDKLGMGQTSVSKNAKALGRYAEQHGGFMTIKGLELVEARPDLLERRRLRMTLTPKGERVIKRIMDEVSSGSLQAG